MTKTSSLLPLLALLITIIGAIKSNAQPAPYKGGSSVYTKLVWGDEFDGKGLPDTAKWNYEKGYLRNNELQFYTENRAENASVSDGYLQITARRDSIRLGSEVYPVTSAGLNTKDKKDWNHGRIEVRAKIPSSLGTWPAIWMLGSNIDQADWPACGEIDIMEHVGYMPDVLHFNVHTEKYNHVKKTNKGSKVPFAAPYKDFHIYAVEWFKEKIDWYLDEKKVFTFINEGTGSAAWPFDQPQYLILNLAFGGAWGGEKGVDLNSLPQTFLIDYVRVYQ